MVWGSLPQCLFQYHISKGELWEEQARLTVRADLGWLPPCWKAAFWLGLAS